MVFLSLLFALLVRCQLKSVIASPQDHRIDTLPGWSPKPLPSRQFSGFLQADDENYLQMHYWFVEAEVNSEKAPLVLWFNGGPGASSLYGLMVELGPFLVSDLSLSGPEYEATGIPQLIYNPYGWQKVANVLALSIPPPVGFSFCSPPGPSAIGNDCGTWNDTATAEVTHYAIKSWLKLFPEYKANEMFLLGESYAGVYVPTIVQQILAYPEDGINLVGFGVGDACTPPEICGSTHYGPYWEIQFLYGKSAFSNQLYEEIMGVCDTDELVSGDMTAECSESVAKIDNEVGGYWLYGYYDSCWYENDIRRNRRRLWSPSGTSPVLPSKAKGAYRQQEYYGPPIAPLSRNLGGSTTKTQSTVNAVELGTTPNENDYVGGSGYACGGPNAQAIYLDLPQVKKALNLPSSATFFQCDNGEDFTYSETEKDVISWYKEIIAEGKLRVLVYNGDTDPCINSYQAQNWTRNLGFAETQSWRPWTLDGCQSMGGYVTRYENNFDFVSIKGAGHMVPLHRPQATLEFISRFLMAEDYKTYDSTCTSPTPDNAVSQVDAAVQNDTPKQILQEMETVRTAYNKEIALLQERLDRANAVAAEETVAV